MAERRGFFETPAPRTRRLSRLPEIGSSTGAVRVAEDFASGFFRLSNRIQNRLDAQVAQQARNAGLIAGAEPTFEPVPETTIANRAFNRAARTTYLSRLETNARNRIEVLLEKHRAEPDALRAALEGYRSGIDSEVQRTVPELRPAFNEIFSRHSQTAIREAGRNAQRIQAQEAEAAVLDALETNARSAERLARLTEDDIEASADLAGEREAFIKKMLEVGPVGAFEFAGREMPADPTRPSALTPVEMQDRLAAFDKRVRIARVMGKFERAPDKEAFADKFVEAEAGNERSPLTFNEIEQLASRMRTRVRAERVELRLEKAALDAQVDDAIEVLEFGKEPPGLDTLRQRARRFPDIAGKLEETIQDRQFVDEFIRLPPAQQQQALNTLAARPKATRRSVALEKRLRKVHSRTVQALDDDPVSFLAESGIMPVDPVSLDDNGESLRRRGRASLFLAAQYGLDHHGLTGDEVDELSQRLQQADTDGRIAMMDLLAGGMNDRRLRLLMGDVAKKQPVFAVAASLVREDAGLARDILRGEAVLQGVGEKSVLPEPSEYMDEAASVLGDALFNSPETYGDVIRAALALDAQRRFRAGELTRLGFDAANFRQAIRDITGGAPIEWNGQSILPPMRGMSEDEFEDMMNRLNDGDLRVGGALPQAGGVEITADRLREHVSLETVGDGLYLIRVADRYALTPSGEPYELDLRAVARDKAFGNFLRDTEPETAFPDPEPDIRSAAEREFESVSPAELEEIRKLLRGIGIEPRF